MRRASPGCTAAATRPSCGSRRRRTISARLNDILGQLESQIDSLKRQARQARRYKELSGEIRRLDAIVLYLRWMEAQAQVDAGEAELAAALEKVARATQAEAQGLRAEAEAAARIQPLREQEAAKGAVLHRFKVEHENLEREAQRTDERRRELEDRLAQLERDRAREEQLIVEAKETLARLEAETASLSSTEKLAGEFEQKALAAYDETEAALKTAESAPQRADRRRRGGAGAPPEPGGAAG